MFVGRTRLVRISTGEVVDQWPVFVRTPAAALSRLDAATRQAVLAEPGDYDLQHQLRCFYRVRVIGRRRDAGHLVLEYAVWRTKASADAGDPPDWTNTHTFAGFPKGFRQWPRQQKIGWLRRHVEDAIRDATHRNASGDERDRRIPVENDDDADIAALDGADVEYA